MTRARVWHDGQLVAAVVEGDALVLENGTRVPSAGARYASPIAPRQIIATHLTYRSRCVEYRMAAPPEYPSYFMKPLGAVSHHGATVARPRGCAFLNYEGELAVVIGRTCTNVPVARALDYVKGYTIANDFGVHDFRHADRGAMFRVKGQDGFCPLGPVMVDAADLDPADVWLRTYVNGEVVQEAHTGTDLMFSVAYQIADISRLVTLEDERRAAHRHAGQQPARAAGRRRGRGHLGHRPPREHGRGTGSRPGGGGRPAARHRTDPARGAGHARSRGA